MSLDSAFFPGVPVFAFGLRNTVRCACRRGAARGGGRAGGGAAVRDLRAKQLEYSWVVSLAGRYEPFWTLTERALDHAFARCGKVDRGLRAALLDAYRTLDPHPEAATVLGSLRARGFRTAILSNGSPDMLASAVSSAGLADLLDEVLSVDAVRVFKTSPRAYALVTSAFGVDPGEVAFVSSNRWDAAGATAFGFRSVWVNRAGLPGEYGDLPPAATVSDLSGLL